jgi:hypothetical protein
LFFHFRCHESQSELVVRGARAATATAIAVALIVILMASPVILTTTTTEAFAASKTNSNKDCNPLKFGGSVESSFPTFAGKTVTIATSKGEYSVKLDYLLSEGYDYDVYYKNVGAEDPRGRILLPAGKPITITLRTGEGINNPGANYVTLYNDKLSDCQILLDHYLYGPGRVPDKDKIVLKIVSVEQTDDFPSIAKITVQVPDASDVVGEHFTKLVVQFPMYNELNEYYIISHGVHVR